MTCFGTCVPAGPSKNAAVCAFTCNFSEGNCSLTHAVSKAFFSVPCITGVLIFVCTRKAALFSKLSVSHTFPAHCSGPLQPHLSFFVPSPPLAPPPPQTPHTRQSSA